MVQYKAEIDSVGAYWFVGYQGDYIYVGDTNPERTFFHAAKLGLIVPLGDRTDAHLPFKTPNFRALNSIGGLN